MMLELIKAISQKSLSMIKQTHCGIFHAGWETVQSTVKVKLLLQKEQMGNVYLISTRNGMRN